jgi:Holliday junction resolvasome RuvABC endonuclease subunit
MIANPVVLALDLATETGWALGKPGDEPRSGTVRFASKGASHPAILHAAGKWLSEFLLTEPVDQAVIEQEVRKRQGKSSLAADDLTLKLIGIAQEHLFGARVFKIEFAPVNTVRKFFIGDGGVERDKAKWQTVQRCRALQWDPADDNAADALAIWAWRCAMIDPAFGTTLSPLFDKRRRNPKPMENV